MLALLWSCQPSLGCCCELRCAGSALPHRRGESSAAPPASKQGRARQSRASRNTYKQWIKHNFMHFRNLTLVLLLVPRPGLISARQKRSFNNIYCVQNWDIYNDWCSSIWSKLIHLIFPKVSSYNRNLFLDEVIDDRVSDMTKAEWIFRIIVTTLSSWRVQKRQYKCEWLFF